MVLKQRFYNYPIVVLAMMIWGMTFIWYKEVFAFLHPLSVVFLRLFIASPVLLGVSLLVGKLQRIRKKDLMAFLLLAFFEPFLYFIGEGFGLNLVSATLGSVIIATIPLFAPIAALLFLREHFTLMNFTGIIISIFGILIVIAGENGYSDTTGWGVLLMFMAVFAAVGYSVLVKKLTHSYNSFSIVSWQTTLGLLLFLPLFIIFEKDRIFQVRWTLAVIIPLVELALFGSALAFIFFTYSIKRLGMARATVFSNLIPVFTAMFSYFILKEKVTFIKVIGILIVVGGLLLTQFEFRAKKRRDKIVRK